MKSTSCQCGRGRTGLAELTRTSLAQLCGVPRLRPLLLPRRGQGTRTAGGVDPPLLAQLGARVERTQGAADAYQRADAGRQGDATLRHPHHPLPRVGRVILTTLLRRLEIGGGDEPAQHPLLILGQVPCHAVPETARGLLATATGTQRVSTSRGSHAASIAADAEIQGASFGLDLHAAAPGLGSAER